MPVEIKNIYFSEKELRTALVNFAVLNQNYLDVDDVEKMYVDKGDVVKVSMLVDKTLGIENNELSFSGAQVGAALMAFCMVLKIPLPKDGHKALETKDDKVSLKITLDQDVDFEDYIISSRITNSYSKRG